MDCQGQCAGVWSNPDFCWFINMPLEGVYREQKSAVVHSEEVKRVHRKQKCAMVHHMKKACGVLEKKNNCGAPKKVKNKEFECTERKN